MTITNDLMVKNKIHDLASQVYLLATGLQNAAPPGVLGQSVVYLLETAKHLEQASQNIENLSPTNSPKP